MVFFSGMPSEAAGPVAETLTPTVMSARAGAAATAVSSAASDAARDNMRIFIGASDSVVVGMLWPWGQAARRPGRRLWTRRPGVRTGLFSPCAGAADGMTWRLPVAGYDPRPMLQ